MPQDFQLPPSDIHQALFCEGVVDSQHHRTAGHSSPPTSPSIPQWAPQTVKKCETLDIDPQFRLQLGQSSSVSSRPRRQGPLGCCFSRTGSRTHTLCSKPQTFYWTHLLRDLVGPIYIQGPTRSLRRGCLSILHPTEIPESSGMQGKAIRSAACETLSRPKWSTAAPLLTEKLKNIPSILH